MATSIAPLSHSLPFLSLGRDSIKIVTLHLDLGEV